MHFFQRTSGRLPFREPLGQFDRHEDVCTGYLSCEIILPVSGDREEMLFGAKDVKSLIQLEAVQIFQVLSFCSELVEQRNDCGEMSVLSGWLSRNSLALSDHRMRGGSGSVQHGVPTCTQPLPNKL